MGIKLAFFYLLNINLLIIKYQFKKIKKRKAPGRSPCVIRGHISKEMYIF
jgi:hypothetical protein